MMSDGFILSLSVILQNQYQNKDTTLIMTKNFKNIVDRYVCLSPLISLPVWFVTSLLVNIVFESKKLALLTLVIGLINWFFVMVHFEICTSSIDNENKIGDILFSIYVTILLILSTYIVFNYGQTILNEFISK